MYRALYCVLVVISSVSAIFKVPEATVEVLDSGFKVSIPDVEGISLFAFHGKLNEKLKGREGGTYSKDILEAEDGRWTFYEPYTELKAGDIIYYWTYVDYFDGRNKLGYTRDNQRFEVTSNGLSGGKGSGHHVMYPSTARPVSDKRTTDSVLHPTTQHPSCNKTTVLNEYETDETRGLTNSEVQRLILLEQLAAAKAQRDYYNAKNQREIFKYNNITPRYNINTPL